MTGGKIVTFYSYKGGTGRSLTLANVAWVLASNGKRVLAIDWDLEAPCLHRYFEPFLADRELRRSHGIIDLLIESSAEAANEVTRLRGHRRGRSSAPGRMRSSAESAWGKLRGDGLGRVETLRRFRIA
jgi:hypothetical protein